MYEYLISIDHITFLKPSNIDYSYITKTKENGSKKFET